MSLTAFAIVNGILAIGILAALAYVCWLPFRLDRTRTPDLFVAEPETARPQYAERLAA